MKTLLIKMSGELFSYDPTRDTAPSKNNSHVKSVVEQIKALAPLHRLGFVIGGGNFFRGALDGGAVGVRATTGHTIGMLSTVVNGIILQDLLAQEDVPSVLLSAFYCQGITEPITQNAIDDAFSQKKCIIFVGGTGNPFFTTDTNAVIRGLQIGAKEIWKATKVDGIYTADPKKDPNATLCKTISYNDVLNKNLAAMDRTAITLAEENAIPIRIFNLFTSNALHKALENPEFGSTIR